MIFKIRFANVRKYLCKILTALSVSYRKKKK